MDSLTQKKAKTMDKYRKREGKNQVWKQKKPIENKNGKVFIILIGEAYEKR